MKDNSVSHNLKFTNMEYVNCTPHNVMLNSGEVYPASGQIARVSNSFKEVGEGLYQVEYGEVENLPEPQEGVRIIVSAMVFAASDRKDLVAPATGHPLVKRDENGRIISVPGFIVK